MQITEFSVEVLTFHGLTFCLGLLVVWRFVARLPVRRALKLALAALVLVVSARYLFSQILFGSMDTMELPRPLIIVINWLFSSVLLLAVFQIALDLLTVLQSILARRWILPAPVWRWALGAIALILSAYGVTQALRIPTATTVEIAVDGLPPEFDGYRILQLSDLHISTLFHAPWVSSMVDAANKEAADVIVISGDLVEGSLDARHEDVQPLQRLRAPDGVFMSPGNHEYYFDYAGWMARFAALGLHPLANSHVVIRRQGAEIVLAGVTDATAISTGLPGPDVQKALAGAPPNIPVVLLAHQPGLAPAAAEAGASVQLSGHTHGGMIVGLRSIVASANSGFVSGLYEVNGMPLYVSNGTALASGFAVRLGVPSEMTMVVLRAR